MKIEWNVLIDSLSDVACVILYLIATTWICIVVANLDIVNDNFRLGAALITEVTLIIANVIGGRLIAISEEGWIGTFRERLLQLITKSAVVLIVGVGLIAIIIGFCGYAFSIYLKALYGISGIAVMLLIIFVVSSVIVTYKIKLEHYNKEIDAGQRKITKRY